tara:strand:- start:21 stop:206 length:186 start_codon:yes stop_codon:yes gene_type:complete
MFFKRDPIQLIDEMKIYMQHFDLSVMFISSVPKGYRALEPGEEHYGTVIAVLERDNTKAQN